MLLVLLGQPIMPSLAQAVPNIADHRLLIFFSNNVLGEFEPCG